MAKNKAAPPREIVSERQIRILDKRNQFRGHFGIIDNADGSESIALGMLDRNGKNRIILSVASAPGQSEEYSRFALHDTNGNERLIVSVEPDGAIKLFAVEKNGEQKLLAQVVDTLETPA